MATDHLRLGRRAFLQNGSLVLAAGSLAPTVLDACFRKDGKSYERKNFDWTDANIPAAELEWLIVHLSGACAVPPQKHLRNFPVESHSLLHSCQPPNFMISNQ